MKRKEKERKDVSFFFQAEDGIRDTSVTGVQTCALPIFDNGAALAPGEAYTSTTSSVVIPERFRGAGYILVVADAGGSIDEYPNEANNVIAKAIVVDADRKSVV